MRPVRTRTAIGGFLAVLALAVPVVMFAIAPNGLGLLSDSGAYFSAVTINAGAGDQYDSHVDGDIASYTSDNNIRYYNFFTGVDQQVPGLVDATDQLSGVSNGKIAFSRLDAQLNLSVMVFDTGTSTTIEVDPQPNPLRSNAAIGGDTVAFVDQGLAITGELVASVLGGATTRVTSDARVDRQPAVAPLGNVIVYESCQTSAANCDVRQAGWNGSSWIVTNLTSNSEPEANPDTDGTVVVYDALRPSGRDIYWQPVGGGIEHQLELPGEQRNPSVSGGLIGFESIAVDEANAEVMVYHIATNRLFAITFSPSAEESLSNVTALPDNRFRVVFSRGPDGSRDVYGVTFELPALDTFDFGGFQQPVDPYPTLNSMKAGAAVPVRFGLGGFQGLDIFAAGYPKSQTIVCGSSVLEAGIEETVNAGGSSLSYDAATDLYKYVWKTERAWAGTCRQLVIRLSDSTSHYANFRFK